MSSNQLQNAHVRLPRVTIEFCTQCKWNLRAAYFAQELLQTFSTSIGEIALIPVTGGIFTITLYHLHNANAAATSTAASKATSNQVHGANAPHTATEIHDGDAMSRPDDIDTTTRTDEETVSTTVIWDRKRDGGFPETKELKNRVRNVIEPGRDMGHVDRALKKSAVLAGRAESIGDTRAGADASAGAPVDGKESGEHGGGAARVGRSEAVNEPSREGGGPSDLRGSSGGGEERTTLMDSSSLVANVSTREQQDAPCEDCR